jgi:hypothetical protein
MLFQKIQLLMLDALSAQLYIPPPGPVYTGAYGVHRVVCVESGVDDLRIAGQAIGHSTATAPTPYSIVPKDAVDHARAAVVICHAPTERTTRWVGNLRRVAEKDTV